MSIQITLAAARVNAGLTQDDTCRLMHVSKNTVVNWESGKSQPTVTQARTLAELYGIPLDCINFLPKETN